MPAHAYWAHAYCMDNIDRPVWKHPDPASLSASRIT